MRTTLLLTVAGLLAWTPALAQDNAAAPSAAKPQWLAVLSLARPALYDPANWTAEDEAKVTAHFRYHVDLARRGVVVLGGRTQDLEPNGHMPADTMGLIILEAEDEAAAQALMAADPAISGGVMTVRLRPYRVAFQRDH